MSSTRGKPDTPLPLSQKKAARPFKAAETESARPVPAEMVIFDIETQRSAKEVGGWHNSHLMRVALAVVYDCATGEFETYMEDRVETLIERLVAAPLVSGFNIRRFDYGVLRGYTSRKLETLATFDLLEDIQQQLGYRLSLDHLARHTLGQHKSADGLQSLEWFRRGELEKIETYCRKDVELVRDLIAFASREGHLVFQRRSGETVRLPVAWTPQDLATRFAPPGQVREKPMVPRTGIEPALPCEN